MSFGRKVFAIVLFTLLIAAGQAVQAQNFGNGYYGFTTMTGGSKNFVSSNYLPLEFEKINLQGFDVYVNKSIAERPETQAALDALDEDLEYVAGKINAKHLTLFKRIKIWVEIKNQPRGSAMYLKNATKEWLTSNGYPLEAMKSVEITNVKNYVAWRNLNQPLLILHEMAHAYHDLHLSRELNAEITAAYNNALNGKKYESVEHSEGGKKRAYALTSADEYFAELTEAYFGENDFFPYNREELEEFDPEGYELMQAAWD